jgi:hypothetical protein
MLIMCCGQKRATLTNHASPSLRKIQSFTPAPADVRLRTGAAFDTQQHTAPRSSPVPIAAISTTQSDSAGLPDNSSYLQYKEQSSIRVRGMASGRIYEFSGVQPVCAVDERDAAALLQTRLFRRA